MYPVSYAADHEADGRNRLTAFFRSIVSLPWVFVAALYGFAAQIVSVIAWFALVFTGRYPEELYKFNAGYLRMSSRANAFAYLLTDEFPAFDGGDDPGYPIRVGIPEPLDAYSRGKALFRLIIGIPVILLALVQGLILSVCTLISWVVIVITAKHPEGLFNPMRSASAYIARGSAYFMLMTEDWPPFSLEDGAPVPAGAIERESVPPQA